MASRRVLEEVAWCWSAEEDTRAIVRAPFSLATLRLAELFELLLTDDTERPASDVRLATLRLSAFVLRLSEPLDSLSLCLLDPLPESPSSRIFGVTTTRLLDVSDWPSEFEVPSVTLGITRVDLVGLGATVIVVVAAALESADVVGAAPTLIGCVVTTVGI